MAVSVWVLEGAWQRALTVSRFYCFGLLRYSKVEFSLLEQADQRNPSGYGLTSVDNGLQPWVLAIGIGHSKAIHNGVRVRIEDDRENRPRIALYVREVLQDLRARGLDISAETVSRKPDAKPMVVVQHYRIGTPVIPFPKLSVYCKKLMIEGGQTGNELQMWRIPNPRFPLVTCWSPSGNSNENPI